MFLLKYPDNTVKMFERRPSHTEITQADIMLEVTVSKNRESHDIDRPSDVARALKSVVVCFQDFV